MNRTRSTTARADEGRASDGKAGRVSLGPLSMRLLTLSRRTRPSRIRTADEADPASLAWARSCPLLRSGRPRTSLTLNLS